MNKKNRYLAHKRTVYKRLKWMPGLGERVFVDSGGVRWVSFDTCLTKWGARRVAAYLNDSDREQAAPWEGVQAAKELAKSAPTVYVGPPKTEPVSDDPIVAAARALHGRMRRHHASREYPGGPWVEEGEQMTDQLRELLAALDAAVRGSGR